MRGLLILWVLVLSACGGGNKSNPAPEIDASSAPVDSAPMFKPPSEMLQLPPAGDPLWAIPPDRSPLWQLIGPDPNVKP